MSTKNNEEKCEACEINSPVGHTCLCFHGYDKSHCSPSPKAPLQWEEEFDKKFPKAFKSYPEWKTKDGETSFCLLEHRAEVGKTGWRLYSAREDIKSFIRNLLTSQSSSLIKQLEAEKTMPEYCVHSMGRYSKGKDVHGNDKWGCNVCDGERTGIQRAIDLLTKEK